MKIAITAASGKLGSLIVETLASMVPNGDVIALARTPEKAKYLGVEVRPGDYNDLTQLEQSLQSVDSVLLISGMDAPDKRIKQHQNVIQAAKNAGVKKIVYTSIQGAEKNTCFSPVVQSNRQTEKDVIESGLQWVIGRNGIYIEPDIEYIETYKKEGGISNCAGNGRCGYTSRTELAFAYAKMLLEDKHNGQTYNLHGEAITQSQLADYLNMGFGTDLIYSALTVEEYKQERIAALGEFIGTVIAGIYQGIRESKSDNVSDYLTAAGREHESWLAFFTRIKNTQNAG